MSDLTAKAVNDALGRALAATCESESIEFKASFDPNESCGWLELVKDIVALANSGGGILVIGLCSDGTPSGVEVSPVFSVDPAHVTDKIYKYTDHQFHGFDFRRDFKGDQQVCVIVVKGAETPMVFTRVGTYAVDAAKQKTAFCAGTVYFRHGAKSEPGNSDDLRCFLERRLEVTRKSWMEGIAKVVEAPAGACISVLPPEVHESSGPAATAIRLVDDASAPAYYAMPIDRTHPYRQKDVAERVNGRLAGKKAVKSYDVFCVRKVFNLDSSKTFCYTQKYASPLYSEGFVDWIVEQFSRNPQFFEETKARYKQLQLGRSQ